jgi:hypothetical protein
VPDADAPGFTTTGASVERGVGGERDLSDEKRRGRAGPVRTYTGGRGVRVADEDEPGVRGRAKAELDVLLARRPPARQSASAARR